LKNKINNYSSNTFG